VLYSSCHSIKTDKSCFKFQILVQFNTWFLCSSLFQYIKIQQYFCVVKFSFNLIHGVFFPVSFLAHQNSSVFLCCQVLVQFNTWGFFSVSFSAHQNSAVFLCCQVLVQFNTWYFFLVSFSAHQNSAVFLCCQVLVQFDTWYFFLVSFSAHQNSVVFLCCQVLVQFNTWVFFSVSFSAHQNSAVFLCCQVLVQFNTWVFFLVSFSAHQNSAVFLCCQVLIQFNTWFFFSSLFQHIKIQQYFCVVKFSFNLIQVFFSRLFFSTSKFSSISVLSTIPNTSVVFQAHYNRSREHPDYIPFNAYSPSGLVKVIITYFVAICSFLHVE